MSQIHRNRKNSGGCQRLEGREDWEALLNSHSISDWDDEKVLEMDISDGCTAM